MDFALRLVLILLMSLILWGLLVYGCIAYVQVEYNPLLWPEDCRIDHAVLTGMLTALSTAGGGAAMSISTEKSW